MIDIPEAFQFSNEGASTSEQETVARWIEEACALTSEGNGPSEVQLKHLPSGQVILAAKRNEARGYVITALAHVIHWDGIVEQLREKEGKHHLDHLPIWAPVWGRRRHAECVIRTLMNRKLPLTRQDLLSLLTWCNQSSYLSPYDYPLSHMVRALERGAEADLIDDPLRDAMLQFASKLGSDFDRQISRLGARVERICAVEVEPDGAPESLLPPPNPAPVGHACVLTRLKKHLGIADDADHESPTQIIGPDQFHLTSDSPLQEEHGILNRLLPEVILADRRRSGLDGYVGKKAMAMNPESIGRLILAGAERSTNAWKLSPDDREEADLWSQRYANNIITQALLTQGRFQLSRAGTFDLILYLAIAADGLEVNPDSLVQDLIQQVESEGAHEALTEGERFALATLRDSLIRGPLLGNPTPRVSQLTKLIGDGAKFCLQPGERWTNAVNRDFTTMPADARSNWLALFSHLLTATSARPSKKWLTKSQVLVEAIGRDRVHDRIACWLPLVAQGRVTGKVPRFRGDPSGTWTTMEDENATCLRGILWLIPTLDRSSELIRDIAAVTLSAYKKLPGVGPRAVKVGNAGVYALSQITEEAAIGQLAMLKVRVKFGTALKEIEKAFQVVAQQLDLPRNEIEEMGVPSYGIEANGRHEQSLGDYRAQILVVGTEARLNWFGKDDKPLKSVPAKVRKQHREQLADLKRSLKDIQRILPAQRDRIDSMFLRQQSWPLKRWRERYLDHPIVGTIASRLLWCVDDVAAIFVDGEPLNREGAPVTYADDSTITLWHPIGRETDEVLQWRERLEAMRISQPFKQAHREIYMLTDAEINTGTYSNRFAAHIIRQHQFNALCAARGWKNRLRLLVDDCFPPAWKELPEWGLRAEFWIEGIGEEYGQDTNESGVFLRLATDQVRFYRTDAASNYAHAGGGRYVTQATGAGQDSINEPIPLDQIPPIVFSEVMRDVDLFVGVASVGNDPTWQDGGPEGRYIDYWNDYSFGELSGSASSRKDVLERLVPRLKISDRCTFSDRFLVVRGEKRTYKIHLGSGNILMEPNDQYLCIVPDSRSRSKRDELFLPFEGDAMLSIILSKAFLLAEDTKIKDPTITRQIDRS